MELTGKVRNVDGFKRYYNDFMKERMNRHKILGELDIWGRMALLLLRAQRMTADNTQGTTVEVRRMDGDRGQFIVHCDDDDIWPHFEELWQEYQRYIDGDEDAAVDPGIEIDSKEQMPEVLWLPIEPPALANGYTWDDVFDWYHRGGELIVGGLEKLAAKMDLAFGTVRNRHADYMAENPSGRLPNSKSHFAGRAIPPLDSE